MNPYTSSSFTTLIIGCGNLLRGDDGVGPILIRRLWELDCLPPHIRLADGGTGGMDVAFQMRSMKNVIIIDACQAGAEPGTLYKVPGEELEELPPLTGLHSHSFRWDHALAFGRWLLKEEYPEKITVYLIEAKDTDFRMELSPSVAETMEQLAQMLIKEFGEGENNTENGS